MSDVILEQIDSVGKTGRELVDYAFSLVDSMTDFDEIIQCLLAKVGEQYDLDGIVIKEIFEQFTVLKCTYEWSRSGVCEMIGLERRFLEKVYPQWVKQYETQPNGVYIYHKGKGELISSLSKGDAVQTFLQVPMYSGGKLIGCVDFTDFRNDREWSESDIDTLKTVGRLISSYFFGMRELSKTREKVRELVMYDPITQLPYFEEFREIVRNNMKNDDDKPLAIICADLTNFKYFNERYGYETGDKILALFARCIYSFFKHTVSCCREYSDNFCAAIRLWSDTDEQGVIKTFEGFAAYFIGRSIEEVADSNIVINFGVCCLDKGDNDFDEAVSNANAARKIARDRVSTGFGKIAVFNRSMIEDRSRDFNMIGQLPAALGNNEFKVYYQPKVNCADRKIHGAEALVRWIKSDGKFVFPDNFIPAFEKDGCIVKVDYFVYETVFKYLRERIDAGLKVVKISMNVSRVHLFSRAFVSYIDLLLQRYRVPVEYLEFELTESIYIEDLPAVMYTVEHLRRKGISVSIDDFGSGYSSLDILTELPANVLKLDKVFMKDVLRDSDKIIISTIIDMSKKLGLEVLCEGVEKEEQCEFLTSACCDIMQGYLFSKPVDVETFNKYLDKDERM